MTRATLFFRPSPAFPWRPLDVFATAAEAERVGRLSRMRGGYAVRDGDDRPDPSAKAGFVFPQPADPKPVPTPKGDRCTRT